MEIRAFSRADTDAVIALWGLCGLIRPWNDPRKDIERKLTVQPELFLVGEVDGHVIATAMAGYDGHRGWVYYFAVDPARRREGFGAALMAEVEVRLMRLGCPKVQLQVRPGNPSAAFYERLGYEPFDAGNFGKRLIADE